MSLQMATCVNFPPIYEVCTDVATDDYVRKTPHQYMRYEQMSLQMTTYVNSLPIYEV